MFVLNFNSNVVASHLLRDSPVLPESFRVVYSVRRFVEQVKDVLEESFPKSFRSEREKTNENSKRKKIKVFLRLTFGTAEVVVALVGRRKRLAFEFVFGKPDSNKS